MGGVGAEHDGAADAAPGLPVTEDTMPSRPHASRRWFLGAGAVVVAGAVGGLVYEETRSPSTVSTGSGDATVSWEPAADTGDGQPPQPFSGEADGLRLAGVSTTTASSGSGAPADPLAPLPLMSWRGTLGGERFELAVSLTLPDNTPVRENVDVTPQFTVKGTFGGRPVVGVVGQETTPFSSPGAPPVRFRGTVGSLQVSGTIAGPSGVGGRQTATASFVVTP